MNEPGVTGTAGPAGRDGPDGEARPAVPRWLGPVTIVVAVAPIWVAVIRNGVQGWFPRADGADTVLRAGDVFDGPFPLVGMKAAGGSQGGYEVNFPGAWQLYAIAVPTRVFGVVWGPLLAMGLVNTVWGVLTGWFLLRRLRPTEALVGISLFALLLWSIGSGHLISPVPMQMVIVPMALLLVAVWAVADGDPWALPVAALVANYLWLDHLVLVVTVPVLAVTGLVGLGFWWSRLRRVSDDPGADTRRTLRGLVLAGLVTVIMWIPPVIQQLTTSPGNLRLLVDSAGAERPIIGSWSWAVHFVVSLIGRPPFWFRGTLEDPPSTSPPIGGEIFGGVAVFDVVVLVVVVGLGIALGVAARRRGDRTGLWLLIVAAVAVGCAILTARSAPTYLGPPHGYLRATWPTAMFVWAALTVNVLRWLRGRLVWSVAAPALAVVVVCTVANFPTAPDGYDADRRAGRVVTDMNAAVVPELRGRGPFMIAEVGFAGHAYGASLRLALARAGVDVCFHRARARGNASRESCPDDVAGILTVEVVDGIEGTVDGEVLYRGPLLADDELAELRRLDREVRDWLAGVDRLEPSPGAQRMLDDLEATVDAPEVFEPVHRLLATPTAELHAVRTDPTFRQFVELWYNSPEGRDAEMFVDESLPPAHWRRWADLSAGARVLFVHETD